jgi:hypothetical protein
LFIFSKLLDDTGSVTSSLQLKNLPVLLQPVLPFGNRRGFSKPRRGEGRHKPIFEQQSPPRALTEFSDDFNKTEFITCLIPGLSASASGATFF